MAYRPCAGTWRVRSSVWPMQLREYMLRPGHPRELGSWKDHCREPLGEVQEMIDVCDFAVGLSRQLYGKTIASERPGHRLAEQWHAAGADRRHFSV